MGDYLKELREKVGHMPMVLPHSVVIVINNQNKILLEERADDGFYDFPGGGIDLKESAEEAAARELKEETGLIANRLDFFKLYSGEITHYVYFNGDEIYGVDANGNPRELHIEKALKVIDYQKYQIKNQTDGVLADNQYFKVRRVNVDGELVISADRESFVSFTFIEGKGIVDDLKYQQFDTFFLPFGAKCTVKGDGVVIISEV